MSSIANPRECVTNQTLCQAMRQLASLLKQADDLFQDLGGQVANIQSRAGKVQGRVVNLQERVQKHNPKKEKLPAGDLVTFSRLKEHFASTYPVQSCLFTPETRSTALVQISAKLDILNSNKFGKFVAQKCYLQVFKRGKEDWRSLLDKEEKVEDMFSDILGSKKKDAKKDKASLKRVAETEVKSEDSVPEKVAKPEITKSTVENWLAGDAEDPKPVFKKAEDPKSVVKKAKKPKAKSYLDDL